MNSAIVHNLFNRRDYIFKYIGNSPKVILWLLKIVNKCLSSENEEKLISYQGKRKCETSKGTLQDTGNKLVNIGKSTKISIKKMLNRKS